MSESRSDNEPKVEAPSKHGNNSASASPRGGKGRTKGEGRANKVEVARSGVAAEPAIAALKAEAPKAEALKAEAPKAEAPKAEAPKAEPVIALPQATAPEAKLAILPPKPEAPKAEAPKAEAKVPADVGRTRPGEVFLMLQARSVKWAARGVGLGSVVLAGGARVLEKGAKVLDQAAQRLDELQEKIKNNESRAAA